MDLTQTISSALRKRMDEKKASHKKDKFIGEFYATDAGFEIPSQYIDFTSSEKKAVFGKCKRQVFFDKVSFDKDFFETQMSIPEEGFSEQMRFRLEFGKVWEKLFIDLLKDTDGFKDGKMNLDWNGKMKMPILDSEYKVSAEYDVLVDLPDLNTKFGVELKTGNGHGFGMKRVMGYKKGPTTREFAELCFDNTLPTPNPQHLLQAAIYLYYFKDINFWKLFYLSSDSFQMSEFTIRLKDQNGYSVPIVTTYTEDNGIRQEIFLPIIDIPVESVMSRFINIGKHIDNGVVPERDFVPYLTEQMIEEYFNIGLISKTARENKLRYLKKEREQSGGLKKSDMNADWQCKYCKWRDQCRYLPRESYYFNQTRDLIAG